MEKKQNYLLNAHPGNILKLLSMGERENPQKLPGTPLPNHPVNPVHPDGNPDYTNPGQGRNEPEKNDPTRVIEPNPAKPEHPQDY